MTLPLPAARLLSDLAQLQGLHNAVAQGVKRSSGTEHWHGRTLPPLHCLLRFCCSLGTTATCGSAAHLQSSANWDFVMRRGCAACLGSAGYCGSTSRHGTPSWWVSATCRDCALGVATPLGVVALPHGGIVQSSIAGHGILGRAPIQHSAAAGQLFHSPTSACLAWRPCFPLPHLAPSPHHAISVFICLSKSKISFQGFINFKALLSPLEAA